MKISRHSLRANWANPKIRNVFLFFAGTLLFLNAGGSAVLYPQIPLEIESPSSVNFTADTSSFTLNFSDFQTGTVTNTVAVTYSVMANDVARTDDVVLAKLDDLFPGISLEAEWVSYLKNGGNAVLAAAQSGWAAIPVQEVGLADKVTEEGTGRMVDGSFVIQYRARAIEDLSHGTHNRVLTVSFADT